MKPASNKKTSRKVINTLPFYSPTDKERNNILCRVGFFEEVKFNRFGKPINKRFVHDGYGEHVEESSDGKILMIHIERDRLTTVYREANEEDKEKFKEAYELFLTEKSERDAKEKEYEDLKKRAEANDKQAVKQKEIKDQKI
jgi:hypothetical protein